MLIRIFLILFILYAAYLLLMYFNQGKILYPGQNISLFSTPIQNTQIPIQKIWLPCHFGQVEMWIVPPENSSGPGPALIFAHGNGEVIDGCVDSLLRFREFGLALVLVEYPGYGRSKGSPSQKTITESFIMAFDTLTSLEFVDTGNIFGFGRSIGTAAICALSMHRPLKGMILQSPFISVKSFAWDRGVPPFLVRDVFDNAQAVRNFSKPVLFIHGLNDSMIPFSHSEKLVEIARQGELVSYPCGHNDCPPDWHQFYKDIGKFLNRNGLGQLPSCSD